MTRAELFRRLSSIPEAERIQLYHMAREGAGTAELSGWDRKGIKTATAICEWLDRYSIVVPTDGAVLCVAPTTY